MLLFIAAVSTVLLVSFLCSIFESVLLSLTRPQIELMVRDGKPAGDLMVKFKDNMDVPIAAILILNTAAHTIGAAVAGASYSNVFSPQSLWIFSIVFTLGVLLFTEIIPKTLGVSYANVLATPVAHGIQALTFLLKPLVLLSERISRTLRGSSDKPVTSVEEIRLLTSLGRNEGVVGTRLAGMIVGATHLRHLQAEDAMLPRQNVNFLPRTLDREAVIEFIKTTGHSRFPVTTGQELDEVTGIVMAKELLTWLLQHPEQDIDWNALQRPPLVVPDSAPLIQLLRTFQESRRHLAIVVDEHGTALGILTLEDVLEEIVGEIADESDTDSVDIYKQADGALAVDAAVDLRRLATHLDVHWDPQSEASTVGGLVTETLERIAVVGDTVPWNGYRIRVEQADRRRVKRVSVRPDDSSEHAANSSD
ncbi:MAG: hemolysin family protein [Pseudomonadota bacterium]